MSALRKGLPLLKHSKVLQKGLIRLGGRLQFADFSRKERHPLLLDGSHPFAWMLIKRTQFEFTTLEYVSC